MRTLLVFVLVGCGVDAPPDAPLPTCASIGCDQGYCTDTTCVCPQPDGSQLRCVPSFASDAGVDAVFQPH